MKGKIFFYSIVFTLFLTTCKKEKQKEDPALAKGLSDATLYESIKSTNGFTFYKNDASILASSKATAHGPWFRVRFNAIAAAALTDNGKLPAGASFPEGSIVVKELFETQQGGLKYIAVMQKASKNENQNANWVWGEFEADGKVYNGIATKGSACVGCHSSGDLDKVRLFDLFP